MAVDPEIKLKAGFVEEEEILLPNGVRIVPWHWGNGGYTAQILLPGVGGWTTGGKICFPPHPSPFRKMDMDAGRREIVRRAIAEVEYFAPEGKMLYRAELDETKRPYHLGEV